MADRIQRAILRGALFVCLPISITAAGLGSADSGADPNAGIATQTGAETSIHDDTLRCEADRFDIRFRVQRVFDGDTVLLESGEKLRLIGVNTPEMGRDGRPAEAGAQQATERLRQLLRENGNVLKLRFDHEKLDKYHRLLAHAFLDNGQSVTAWLLQQGLGVRISFPPNLWNLPCYKLAEQSARRARRGLWQPSGPLGHIPLAKNLPARTKGFRLIEGRVISVGESRRSVWLNLQGRLSLRIAKADMLHFINRPPDSYTKKYILVRGWIHPGRQGSLQMRLRHPADIEILPYQLQSIPVEPQR
jgi:endonuclease YncB( thermonuclease family)